MAFGALLAVLCALVWSVAVVMFKKAGDDLHPVLLNLLKNGLAFVLMVPTVLLTEGAAGLSLDPWTIAILLVSGLVGIGIADALVLKSLYMVGATRIAVVECIYSPSVILLSLLFLGEQLTVMRIVGAAMVLAAILCVSIKREANSGADAANVGRGMLIGVAGLFSMAAGIVMIKPLFAVVPLFWIIAIRLGAGTVASVVIFHVMCDRRRELAALRATPRKGLVLAACILSTYVSMILWVAGYKYNDAMITAVLNQTSTIFTVVLATLLLKERFTTLKAVGTGLAVAGVLVMTLA